MKIDYLSLAERWPESEWLQSLCDQATRALQQHNHGDLPRWREAIGELPKVSPHLALDRAAPELGGFAADMDRLRETLMAFHPWRKGPLKLAGQLIDTEWRSDWKWQRIAPHIDLHEHRVLDIGCGNGYFGWRMLAAGAKWVAGIDPTLVFVMQWLACRHFAPGTANYVLPLGIEHLPDLPAGLDTVFSMGVLYHRRDPLHHLQRLHELLRAGGVLVLETLVLPSRMKSKELVPEGRYARMRNVWSVPSIELLRQQLNQAGFDQVKVADITPTSLNEQRTTDWMTFESLDKALDPNDGSRTIEGYPAPIRAVLIARR